MARLKNSVSGWRRAFMAHGTTADDVSRQAKAYVAWLCLNRGWYTETRICTECHGSGWTYDNRPPTQPDYAYERIAWRRSYKRWEKARVKAGRPTYLDDGDKITCWGCGGSRRERLPERLYDTSRAEAYMSEQRADLEALAQAGVDGIRHRLFWHGFRPVVQSCRYPVDSAADYDRRETVRAGLVAQMDRAYAEAAEARAEGEAAYAAASDDDRCAMLNASDPENNPASRYEYVRAADRRCEALRNDLYAFGHCDENCWAIPGTAETIHVGTKGPRRGYDVKPAHSIVLEPGRAPGSTELDALAGEALAAVAGPVDLPLAA